MLKDDLFANLLSECFGSMRKSVTFASAFELKVRAKQSEILIGRRQVKKEFFEKIYIRQIK